MNWVMLDAWTPMRVAPAITGEERTSTMRAGARVIRGASSARKATSSSTTMSRSDSDWMLLCELPDWLCESMTVGRLPARWNWRGPLPGNSARIVATRFSASADCEEGGKPVGTSPCSACRSGERPKSLTSVTCGIVRTRDSTDATDAVSVPASVVPPLVAATSVIVAWLLFWNGDASWVACMDAEFWGRKPLVVSLATEGSEGNAFTEMTVTMIQPTRSTQRKRTEKRPRPAKSRVIGRLSCRWIAVCRRRWARGPGGGLTEVQLTTSPVHRVDRQWPGRPPQPRPCPYLRRLPGEPLPARPAESPEGIA